MRLKVILLYSIVFFDFIGIVIILNWGVKLDEVLSFLSIIIGKFDELSWILFGINMM